jgi:hypothetical protein
MYVRQFSIHNTICLLLYLLTRNLKPCSYHICPIFLCIWYFSALKVNYIYIIFIRSLLRPTALTQVFLGLLFRLFCNTYRLIHESISWIGGSHFCWVKLNCEIWGCLLARLKMETANCIKTLIPSFQHTLCSFSENMNLVNLIFFRKYLLTYLLTYSMEQSPSWEANQFSGRTFRLKFTDVCSGHRICL